MNNHEHEEMYLKYIKPFQEVYLEMIRKEYGEEYIIFGVTMTFVRAFAMNASDRKQLEKDIDSVKQMILGAFDAHVEMEKQ